MIETNIISLGLGVQSTALYYMSSMGLITRADYAIFVDTGREKSGTLEYLKLLKKWQRANRGIPIKVVKRKNLYLDLLKGQNSQAKRFSSIPAFTKNTDGSVGMLRRQCTGEYKIEQVDQEIRKTLSVKRILGQIVNVWKGISLDEIERLNIPNLNWKIHKYPFCGYSISNKETNKMDTKLMTRNDIINWYNENNLSLPPKSACVFCPYQSDSSWKDMKENSPSDFKAAARIDKAIRDSTTKGINNQIFLHKSCIPLNDIVFNQSLPDLWSGECSGTCHN